MDLVVGGQCGRGKGRGEGRAQEWIVGPSG